MIRKNNIPDFPMLLFITETEECVEHLNLLAIHHVSITDLVI